MKGKVLNNILFFYCVLAAFFITISSALNSQIVWSNVFTLLFLPVLVFFIIEFFSMLHSKSEEFYVPQKTEIIVISVVFLFLLIFSIRNIYINTNNSTTTPNDVQEKTPLIFKVENSPTQAPISTITVLITDGSPSINIRQKPTIYSEKVGEAKDGDIVEFVSLEMGWYKVKLTNNSFGYISSKYIKK